MVHSHTCEQKAHINKTNNFFKKSCVMDKLGNSSVYKVLLLGKHEDMNLDPYNPSKKPGLAVRACLWSPALR